MKNFEFSDKEEEQRYNEWKQKCVDTANRQIGMMADDDSVDTPADIGLIAEEYNRMISAILQEAATDFSDPEYAARCHAIGATIANSIVSMYSEWVNPDIADREISDFIDEQTSDDDGSESASSDEAIGLSPKGFKEWVNKKKHQEFEENAYYREHKEVIDAINSASEAYVKCINEIAGDSMGLKLYAATGPTLSLIDQLHDQYPGRTAMIDTLLLQAISTYIDLINE